MSRASRTVRPALAAIALACFASATAAAPAGALPASARITTAGLGAVKIGMTERQVSRAARTRVRRRHVQGTCSLAKIGEKVTGLFTGRLLARIYVDTRRYATRSGVRVGDSESRVLRAYRGDIRREPHKYRPGGSYLQIVDGNRKVVFETDGEKVTSISTGRRPEIDLVEGCS